MGYKWSDSFKGQWRSLRNGTGGSFSATLSEINKVKKEREAAEKDLLFGDGEQYGNENWEPPVHATTLDGKPVTVSFGKGRRAGHTLIADGHVTRTSFYDNHRDGLPGHDHYLVDGAIGSRKDRNRYQG